MEKCHSQEIIKQAWQGFGKGVIPSDTVRPEILQSWQRCKGLGVNRDQMPNILDKEQLDKRLELNSKLIKVSQPALENLYRFVAGSGYVIALSDAEGYLLYLIGDEEELKSAALGNGVLGADWSEKGAGTNGIGTPLYLSKPMLIFGCEHYSNNSQGWNASGAPIRDPSGKTIGAISAGATFNNFYNHTLGMIVATAHAIEMQLRMKEAWEFVDLANQTIMDSFSKGVIVIDSDDYVILVNKVSLEMLKIEERELLGINLKALISDKSLLDKINRRMEVTEYETEIDTGTTRLQCSLTCRPIIKKSGCNGVVIVINETLNARKAVHNIAGARLTFRDIIGNNIRFCATLDVAKAASRTDSNVLLLGESGTGKEIFAQAIHNSSSRRNGPFIAINCGAIPRELIASELFGYADGAFTGAKRGGSPGKFELADGGTIFLDEIGEMPLELQTALLRVLENRTFTRVGGRETLPVDVRIIAATNKDLEEEVKLRNFRQDLFYRLNVLLIKMVPLRERKDDIRPLAEAFLSRLISKYGKPINKISQDVWEILLRYPWSGNIRELQNVLERAVALAKGQQITTDLLPFGTMNLSIVETLPAKQNDDQVFELNEADELIAMLEENRWNLSKVSLKLGIARTTLYRRMERYNLWKRKVPHELQL